MNVMKNYKKIIVIIIKDNSKFIIYRNKKSKTDRFKFLEVALSKPLNIYPFLNKSFKKLFGHSMNKKNFVISNLHYKDINNKKAYYFVFYNYKRPMNKLCNNIHKFKKTTIENISKFLKAPYIKILENIPKDPIIIKKDLLYNNKSLKILLYDIFKEKISLDFYVDKRKSSYAALYMKNNKFFLKIKNVNDGYRELIGYYNIRFFYPVPKLIYFIRLRNKTFLFYEYEKSIRKDKGLFLDFLNKKNDYNLHNFEILINFFISSYKIFHIYSKNYPSNIYFLKRVYMLNKLLRNKKISWILDYKFIVNNKKFNKNARDLIKETINYFNSRPNQLCFLNQGDPLLINLGEKPIFFDLESAGINPISSDFAIFFWGIFIAESYYYARYHPESYNYHNSLLKNLSSKKPVIKYKIDKKKKIIDIKLEYKLSKIQKDFFFNYKRFLKKTKQSEIEKSFRYFLLMRILTPLDISKYKIEDLISTLAFLHYFYNSELRKDLNIAHFL